MINIDKGHKMCFTLCKIIIVPTYADYHSESESQILSLRFSFFKKMLFPEIFRLSRTITDVVYGQRNLWTSRGRLRRETAWNQSLTISDHLLLESLHSIHFSSFLLKILEKSTILKIHRDKSESNQSRAYCATWTG